MFDNTVQLFEPYRYLQNWKSMKSQDGMKHVRE